MAKTIASFITENNDVFRTLVKVGAVPITVQRKVQIYTYYNSLQGGKMQRYQETASAMRSNITDVRKAVREMNRNV